MLYNRIRIYPKYNIGCNYILFLNYISDGDYDNCNDNGAEMITMTGGEFVGLAIGFLCLGVLLSVLPMLCYIVCVGSRTFFGILERLRCN